MGYDPYDRDNMQARKDLAKATERVADAQADQAAAYRERTEMEGKTAYADRFAQARTDGLRMALANLDGNPSMETIEEYAEQFANYILFGTQHSAPTFPGNQV